MKFYNQKFEQKITNGNKTYHRTKMATLTRRHYDMI